MAIAIGFRVTNITHESVPSNWTYKDTTEIKKEHGNKQRTKNSLHLN